MNDPRFTDEQAVELATNMLSDPLAQRFIKRVQASGDNRVYSAEDVLGERLMRMAALITIEVLNPGHTIMPVKPDADRVATLVGAAALALAGKPYLWTEEVRQTVGHMTVPRHTISPRILPEPRSWHTFEAGINLGGELDVDGQHYENGVADCMMVCDRGDGIDVRQYGEITNSETGEARQTITGGLIKYGAVWPDDFEPGWDMFAEAVLMMFSFLNSPYIPKRQERASRAARRDAIRQGKPLEDETVTFVTLRRPEPRKKHDPQEGEPVHWKHQWVVSGHHRAQWYPSEQAHHLIWIAPYLKGPADAPMLEHAYRVAR